ncbi:MAG: hypothetical protein ACPGQD_07345, partial [Planctomycetota bacterium]
MKLQDKSIADFELRDYRSFAYRDEDLLPGLSDLQSRSYEEFLQVATPSGRRKEQGLDGKFVVMYS